MDTSKLKPFNLEDALAGKPVVTRNGIEVLEIAQLKRARERFSVIAVLALQDSSVNNTQSYDSMGRCGWPGRSSDFDLFMAPTERTVWVNLYEFNVRNPDKGLVGNAWAYESEADADAGASLQLGVRFGGKAHPITVTE